jgi:hypothetical protein
MSKTPTRKHGGRVVRNAHWPTEKLLSDAPLKFDGYGKTQRLPISPAPPFKSKFIRDEPRRGSYSFNGRQAGTHAAGRASRRTTLRMWSSRRATLAPPQGANEMRRLAALFAALLIALAAPTIPARAQQFGGDLLHRRGCL